MTTYVEQVLRAAREQERLLIAADALCGERQASRALRLCFSALMLLILTLIPAQGGAMLF